MQPTQEQIENFRQLVIKASNNPDFVHHQWFVKYHLEIVDQIATELLDFYPKADASVVKILVWLHDYGKALDFDNQYEATLVRGRDALLRLGFDQQFVDLIIGYMELVDRKLDIDLRTAPIEVQIVSSADGCSHFIGPFMNLWWYENANKPFQELMQGNLQKAQKDWNHKIVLPEARKAFEARYRLLLEQSGTFPEIFIS